MLDLVRFGKNVLFALVLLVVIAALSETNLPATQRLEEYITFVLTTEFDYEPLVELGQNFGLSGVGSLGEWWGRWRDRTPALPAGAPGGSFLAAPGGDGG